MRVALTGTPGVGKTTTADVLEGRGYEIHRVNELVAAGLNTGRDAERGSLLADLGALEEELRGETGIFEGHLSHLLDVDLAIVLRCSPGEMEARGMDEENIEAEALDLILSEAVEMCNDVHEIDTTPISPEEVADLVEGVIEGSEEHPHGKVDWAPWLLGET